MKQVLKCIATGLISTALSLNVFANDSLEIASDTPDGFSGTFYADSHTVSFSSTLESQTEVKFTIVIDGKEREANFNLRESQFKLTDGNEVLTPDEQDLMYDTAQSVAAYVIRSQEDLGEHLVVLVGAMDYWSALNTIH